MNDFPIEPPNDTWSPGDEALCITTWFTERSEGPAFGQTYVVVKVEKNPWYNALGLGFLEWPEEMFNCNAFVKRKPQSQTAERKERISAQ